MNARKILTLATILASTVARSGDLDVVVNCPNYVSYGTGSSVLVVDVDVTNSSYANQIVLRRYAALMAANPGQSATGLAVYGPFARASTQIVIPPTISWPPTPVRMRLSAMNVPNIVNTLANLHIEFLSETGHTLGGGDCLVRILK
jgi:hypothetical protein